MQFEKEGDVLDWYENNERILTPAKIDELRLDEADQQKLDPKFVPVIQYIAGVEGSTEGHFAKFLQDTPSGRDPHVRRLIDRWSKEEMTHAELLREFLEKAGGLVAGVRINENEKVGDEVGAQISTIKILLANVLGEHFVTTHLVYGFLSERSTAAGYSRLAALAGHPVLTRLLRHIKREEEIHATVYKTLAQMRLQRSSPVQRGLVRKLVETFWNPVGEGVATRKTSETVITTLLDDTKLLEDGVDSKVAQLPGFEGSKIVSKRVQKVLDLAS